MKGGRRRRREGLMTDLPAVPGEEARSSVLESGPLTHTRVGLGVGVGGGRRL